MKRRHVDNGHLPGTGLDDYGAGGESMDDGANGKIPNNKIDGGSNGGNRRYRGG